MKGNAPCTICGVLPGKEAPRVEGGGLDGWIAFGPGEGMDLEEWHVCGPCQRQADSPVIGVLATTLGKVLEHFHKEA